MVSLRSVTISYLYILWLVQLPRDPDWGRRDAGGLADDHAAAEERTAAAARGVFGGETQLCASNSTWLSNYEIIDKK